MKIDEAKVLAELYETYDKNMLMEEDKKLIKDVIEIIEKQSWPKHANDYIPIERIERLEEKVDNLSSSIRNLSY